jgi:nucleoside-diphosphate-sugar epimerase
MSTFLIAGSGPVGATAAKELVVQGHEVIVMTRRGTGPSAPGITNVAGDARDVEAIARNASGAIAILNCVNPPYHQWATQWPPIASAFIQAAERSGAALVTMSNLYGYGPSHQTMSDTTSLDSTGAKGGVRAAMWVEAKAAHDAGRIRATEVRASDFFGPFVIDANMGERVVPRVLAGKSIQLLGKLDVPHSFSYTPDVAATLATLATSEEAWGKPWLVPSIQSTQRDLITALARAAKRPVPKLTAVPNAMLRIAGVFSPLMKALQEVTYQFTSPFVVDASSTTAAFGITATSIDVACKDTVSWWQDRH